MILEIRPTSFYHQVEQLVPQDASPLLCKFWFSIHMYKHIIQIILINLYKLSLPRFINIKLYA